MADNQSIHGIRDDEPRPGRGKARGGQRKPFALEFRMVRDPNAPTHSAVIWIRMGTWGVWGRYTTASRRDQAYAALVKKEASNPFPSWCHWEYRKRDD